MDDMDFGQEHKFYMIVMMFSQVCLICWQTVLDAEKSAAVGKILRTPPVSERICNLQQNCGKIVETLSELSVFGKIRAAAVSTLCKATNCRFRIICVFSMNWSNVYC
jgi:hypothetical protein